MTPEDLVTKPWATDKIEHAKSIYKDGVYQAAIGIILTTRYINYTNLLFEKKGGKTEVVEKRILELIDDANEKTLLTEDLIFNLIKTLSVKHSARMRKLLSYPKVIQKLRSWLILLKEHGY